MAAVAVLLMFAILTPRPLHAQVVDDGAGYLTPFPGGEVYRLQVIGDSLAEGLQDALQQSLGGDPRVEIDRKMRWLSGVSRADYAEELKSVAQGLATEKKNIVVVLLGTQDRWSLRGPNGRVGVGSREWRDLYGKRLGEVTQAFKANGVSVYWVGLPIMRRGDVNEAVQAINDVMRERAYLAGIKFIDVYAGFADENGEFSPYGPDLAGTPTRLRERDGILMTEAGYAKLAHFVEREVKRDLSQAKNERSIPLAGSEEEQSRINPGARQRERAVAAAGGFRAVSQAEAVGASLQAGAAPGSDASGDQRADNSRINVKSAAADGREETFSVEIVRPAIPAAVMALVTRRESRDKASQMGDSVVDQIPGGLTVMSSITPAVDTGAAPGSRRKVSPTQTPYFRVLVKGERIAPRSGRADDTSWPRPEPPPTPKSAEAGDGATPAAGASAPGNVATGSVVPADKRQRRSRQ